MAEPEEQKEPEEPLTQAPVPIDPNLLDIQYEHKLSDDIWAIVQSYLLSDVVTHRQIVGCLEEIKIMVLAEHIDFADGQEV